jgi:alanine racemase
VTFPRATIDTSALRSNLAVVRRLAPRSRVMAVIKANAYGHGLVPVARALDSADAYGVARLEEALALRDASFNKRILLLEGVFSAEQLAAAGQRHLDIVVHSREQIEMLEQHRGPHRFSAWLKLDTGMNRLGFRADHYAQAHAKLSRCAAIAQLRAMTHLVSSEQRDDATTRQQLGQFRALTDALKIERSAANSGGVLFWPEAHFDWVRPGLMLYGISPASGASASALDLRPAMTLATQVIAIRQVDAGGTVGYNGTWRAQRSSSIAIVGVGYGDGYPRRIHDARVLVGEREAPIVGRVSMDMTAIDVTDLPGVSVGDAVTLWGSGLPVEQVAGWAETIGYELVCRLTSRVAVEWKT